MALDLTGPQSIVESILFEGNPDAGTIHREPFPSTTFDPVTGGYLHPPAVLVYDGPIVLGDQTSGNQGGQQTQGAVSATRQRWQLKIPFGSPEIHVGDVVTMTASRDADLVGRRFVVRDIGGGSFKVLRRLSCERWEPGGTEDWLKP